MASFAVLKTLVDKYCFLFKEMLCHDPEDALKFCVSLQKEWNENFAKDSTLKELMQSFKKTRCIHLVWMSDKFGRSPSEENSELSEVKEILSDVYDRGFNLEVTPPNAESQQAHTSDIQQAHSYAEYDRNAEVQLRQHLNALIYLFSCKNSAGDSTPWLSEDLIKHVHRLLMKDLYIDADTMINAGIYRTVQVSSGIAHTYPDYNAVPSTMQRIVAEYNERTCQQDHNPFHLAGWLLHELIEIHPFEDGNGRVSRLMWCFSLINDGLPFPVTPFPEHRQAYKKYLYCIERDRELSTCKYLHSMTLISVTVTWKHFILYLKSKAPQKYKEILDWLQVSGNALTNM